MAWLFVPGLADLNSVSSLPWLGDTELSVMSSGKLMQQPSSWRAWKNRPWTRLLSGTISRPSTAADGVTWWRLSLLESLANRSALPASGEESTTRGGSGQISGESSTSAEPDPSSWRTLPESERLLSPSSWPTLPKAGGLRNGAFSERQMLEPLTSETGSSYWPTPAAQRSGSNQGGAAGRVGKVRPPLDTLATLWPTPTAGDANSSGSAAYTTDSGRHSGTTLTDKAVRNWPTPTSRDWKGRNQRNDTSCLPGAVASHQDQSQTDGGTEPGTVLSPQFVETLLGLPIGWTDCDASVTQSSLSKQLSPSDSSQRGSDDEQ